MSRRLLPAVGLAAALLAGCSGSGDPAAAPTPAAASSAPTGALAAPTCEPSSARLDWPDGVPADLPAPPGSTLTEVQERPDGLRVITFSTTGSLRDGVLFVVEQLPAAGFTLARGDAENTEADVPFVKGDVRGVLRMIAVEQCRTDWLMALATTRSGAPGGGGSPLLPPRPDASPLPFG